MMRPTSNASLFAILIWTAAILACGGGAPTAPPPPPPPPPPNAPQLSLTVPGSLTVGGTLPATVTGVPPAAAVTWISENPSIATVTDGQLFGVSPGNAIVRVSSAGALARATVTVLPPFWAFAIGPAHGCVVALGGNAANPSSPDVYCWGYQGEGQLGKVNKLELCLANNNTAPCSITPRLNPAIAQAGMPGGFSWLAASLENTCGLTPAGAAWCWGSNVVNQLGSADTTCTGATRTPCSLAPVFVTGATGFRMFGAGERFGCGIGDNQFAYCWGVNQKGSLGSPVSQSGSPVAVLGNHLFSTLAVGRSHVCGVDDSGQAWCWGDNGKGQIGNGAVNAQGNPQPTAVVQGGVLFRSISAGRNHTCGIDFSGKPYCWGDNSSGQLGDGTTTDRQVPVPVVTSLTFGTLTLGDTHTCGLAEGSIGTFTQYVGVAYCWGNNEAGMLGDGTYTNRLTPTPVQLERVFRQLEAMGRLTCGLHATRRTLFCWGDNQFGQLGNGDTRIGNSNRPVGVAGGPS